MKEEYKKLKKLIERADNILIITHRGPDFDAFASSLILKNYINTFYPKKNVVFKTKQNPSQKIPLMEEITIVQEFNTENEELVIIMDAGGWGMCVSKGDTIQVTKAKVAVVDHHITKGIQADVVINDQMSSTTEQILDFCMSVQKRYKITPTVSILGQIGIVYDTGRFAYDNTTPHTYEMMAKLTSVYRLNIEEFEYKSAKFPASSLTPIKVYIENIHIVGDMAYTYINKKDIESLGITQIGINGAYEFVRDNIIRYIQGVHWGFILKPSSTVQNEWKVSFRSSKEYQEVATVAEMLGGGGHQYASAAVVVAQEGDNAAEIVLNAINKVLTSQPSSHPSSVLQAL